MKTVFAIVWKHDSHKLADYSAVYSTYALAQAEYQKWLTKDCFAIIELVVQG